MALPLLLSLHIVISTLVLCLTIGAVYYNLLGSRGTRNVKTDSELYEDKDGVASPETQKQYSVKLQNVFATIFAVAGFGVACANAVLGMLNERGSEIDGWVQFVLWVSLILSLSDSSFWDAGGIVVFSYT